MKYLVSLLLGLCLSCTAFADSPHFVKGPTASFDSLNGDYCVSFKEAGLGNIPITFTLSVTSEIFTWQCFTKSGNTPEGAPNSVSFSNQSVSTTITPHNGQISASLCEIPQQDGASCQGHGLELKLIDAAYSGITFCDVTDNICFTEPNLSGQVNH